MGQGPRAREEGGVGAPTGTSSIELESYRRMAARVDLSGFGPLAAAIVARVIHATADLEYAATMVVDETTAAAGVAALRRGAPVVVDVEMVRAGLSVGASCHLPPASASGPESDATADAGGPPPTRSAAGIRAAAARHPDGAVFVVGCAPTALDELVTLAEDGRLRPALVVGTPVGFVGAAEAKARALASGLPVIANGGEKGGSAVAAAVINALVRLALAEEHRG